MILIPRAIKSAARGRLFADAALAPRCEIAIVPGARVIDGRPSAVLEDRLEAARTAIDRVDRILVSGNAEEVETMAVYLIRQGVPDNVITRDPRGLRTRLTMERAASSFGVKSALICTNAFHLPRSVYLARAFGIDAYGLIADRREYRHALRNAIRERFACARAIFEVTGATSTDS